MRKPGSIAHIAYLVTIGVKGFDGAIELLIGLAIWLAGPQRFYPFIVSLAAPELEGRLEGHILRGIRHGLQGLVNVHIGFVVFYLLVHGTLKLGIAVALLRGHSRWIFPVSSLILTGFIIFMGWHLSERWSNWLFGFALFDFLTLALVLNEWRQPKSI